MAFIRIIGVAIIFVLLAAPEWPSFESERFQLDTIIGQQYFDFLTWGIKAFAAKGEAFFSGGEQYLNENQQKEFVLAYLADLREVRRLEGQIDAIYADPEIVDPGAEAEELQNQVAILRADLSENQPIAESILQNQVSAIVNEEGFEIGGYTWPPVLMHMTPLPMVLIVSPREEIKQIFNIPLNHGLSTETKEIIETGIYDNINRSALVTPIGGLGFYPAMIVETSDINYLVSTIAHEWAHHWLSLHPVGLNVFANNELLRINETVASIVGDEIGKQVINRYYPEFSPIEESESEAPDNNGGEPPPFDFNAEMRLTRVKVDELLAKGQVNEAEDYMEARRQFLWDNGYRFRKLNQAFFAFRGSYADEPGEQGDDPIGPTLLAIREDSPSLKSFLDELSSVTSVSDLEQIAREHGIS